MERIDDLNLNGKKILQDTDLFLFGMDSVLLANMVNKTNESTVLVDLGTGSGVMPIIILEKIKMKKIIGVELQEKMYNLAVKNIKLNGAQDKFVVLNEDLKNIEKIKEYIMKETSKDKVDIVISNPPYKQCGTGVINEVDEKYIARHEIKCTLEDIFKTASKLLKFKGKLYLVHKPERIVDLLSVARKYNLEAKHVTLLQPTVNDKPSIVLIEYVLGGKNECTIEKTIVEYDDKGNYTKEILDIYVMNK